MNARAATKACPTTAHGWSSAQHCTTIESRFWERARIRRGRGNRISTSFAPSDVQNSGLHSAADVAPSRISGVRVGGHYPRRVFPSSSVGWRGVSGWPGPRLFAVPVAGEAGSPGIGACSQQIVDACECLDRTSLLRRTHGDDFGTDRPEVQTPVRRRGGRGRRANRLRAARRSAATSNRTVGRKRARARGQRGNVVLAPSRCSAPPAVEPERAGLGAAYVAGDLDADGDIFEVVTALRDAAPKDLRS